MRPQQRTRRETTAPAGKPSGIRRVPASRPGATLAEDVRAGFARRPRELAPKYLYDARGSDLFERICELPEYYLTRAEAALLDANAARIVAASAPRNILEFGAGSARKTESLITAGVQAGEAVTFWPMDVSKSALMSAVARLAERFPQVPVHPLAGDHTTGLDHLPGRVGPTLFVFLGSTLGNFEAPAAHGLLSEIAAAMAPADRLLLGVDTMKDPAKLEAAYNDSAGVTAAFNANILHVLNRELGGDLDVDSFRHRAVFNPKEMRIESYLDATRPQTATLAALGERHHFAPGDSIFTEISRKFTLDSLDADLTPAGLVRELDFHAPQNAYALHLIKRADA